MWQYYEHTEFINIQVSIHFKTSEATGWGLAVKSDHDVYEGHKVYTEREAKLWHQVGRRKREGKDDS